MGRGRGKDEGPPERPSNPKRETEPDHQTGRAPRHANENRKDQTQVFFSYQKRMGMAVNTDTHPRTIKNEFWPNPD